MSGPEPPQVETDEHLVKRKKCFQFIKVKIEFVLKM